MQHAEQQQDVTPLIRYACGCRRFSSTIVKPFPEKLTIVVVRWLGSTRDYANTKLEEVTFVKAADSIIAYDEVDRGLRGQPDITEAPLHAPLPLPVGYSLSAEMMETITRIGLWPECMPVPTMT